MKTIVLLLSLCGLGAASAGADYQQVEEQAKNLNAAQLNALGLQLSEQARYRDAEWVYRQSLAAWDRLGPRLAASRSITAGNLGAVLQAEGKYPEAEALLLDRLKQAESGGANPQTAAANSAVAALYRAWERPQKAEPFALRADEILRQFPDASAERAANRRILSSILLAERRYAEGEALLRRLLDALPQRAAVGAYNDLAVAETQQGHLTEAEPLAAHAAELARQAFPAAHPLIAVSLNNLAQVERFQGRYLEAEENYRQAIAVWEQALGPQHPDTAKGDMNLAAFYHERGRDAGAEDLYRRAAAIFETALGKNHPLALVARNELAEVLRAEHRYSESERLTRETLKPLEDSLDEKDPRVIRALTNYARLLAETRHQREAAAVQRRLAGLAQGFTGGNP